MRLKTSSSIAEVVRTNNIWYFRKDVHLLKLLGSMIETLRTLQIFSRLTCTTVESGLERGVQANEVLF